MLKWLRRYPFAGMLVAMVAGILLSYYDLIAVWPVLLAAATVFLLLLLLGVFLRSQRETVWGSAALVFLFAFSVWHTTRAIQRSDWDERSVTPQVYAVQVLEDPVERAKSYMVRVRLEENKRAVLYMQKDSTLRLPVPGDLLLVRTAITCPKPADEFSFDYGKYLRLQGYVGSGVVGKGGMVYAGHKDLCGLMPAMHRLRNRIETLFDGFALRERSVLEALLLGDRRHLNADTREAFAASGAMHVLAVSGLHVGIIATMLVWLVSFGNRRKPSYEQRVWRYLQAAILCLALVFYAVLTGLSPSVSRSVLMFILLSIGSLIRPNRSRYNDIAASAFLILLANPLALFHSGFLLSYSAVLAIVRFYPLMIIYAKNKFIRRVWDIVAVSLCAQLGTLPWTICFFHRVSNYFVLTNLGVLPLVEFLLIPTFFVFLLLSPVPWIGPLAGKLLERETWVMNEYVGWIQALSGSSAEVYLNGWLTAILIAIVVCFMLRGYRRWWIAGALTVLFVVGLCIDYRDACLEKDTRTYRRGKEMVIMAREGRTAMLLSNDSTYAFRVTHDYRLARHVKASATTYFPLQEP
ncbi:MAG: ComEC/Rec2 family competence protein [Paludibacteraceae bacterium]|nr:ComEC/Rec2 family competence protein [Paludibacteraceae bacterium]